MNLKYPEKTGAFFMHVLKNDQIKKFLSQLKEFDSKLYLHSMRVGLLCIDCGIDYNYNEKDLTVLACSGLLHEIGKLKTPYKNIEEIENHPKKGFLILEHFEFKEVRKIVVGHHEYSKTNPFPRKDTPCMKKKTDRREYNKKRLDLTQIVSLANMTEHFLTKKMTDKELSKSYVEELLKKEFAGNSSLIPQVLCRF